MNFTTFRIIFAMIAIVVLYIKLYKSIININLVYQFLAGLSLGFLFGMLTIG